MAWGGRVDTSRFNHMGVASQTGESERLVASQNGWQRFAWPLGGGGGLVENVVCGDLTKSERLTTTVGLLGLWVAGGDRVGTVVMRTKPIKTAGDFVGFAGSLGGGRKPGAYSGCTNQNGW